MAGQQVLIMWLPVPGAVRYNVYMNGKKILESQAPPAQVPAPTDGGDYLFEITAVDAAGGESGRSQPGKVSIFVLASPKNLIASFIGGSPALRWDAVKGAAFYNVYRMKRGETAFRMVGSVQDTSYTDGDAKKGTQYFYAVTAKSAAGAETDPEKAKVAFDWPDERAVTGGETPWAGRKARLVRTIVPDAGAGRPALQGLLRMILRPEGLFILDPIGARAGLFSREGNLIRWFGEEGYLEGQLQKNGAVGMVVTRDGRHVVLLDGINWKLVYFDMEGAFVREVPVPASPKDKPEENPVGKKVGLVDLAQGKGGEFYIADLNKSRVLVLNEEGKYLNEFGGPGTDKDRGPGFFAGVQGIGLDGKGNVYVCDFSNNQVQAFSPDGKFLAYLGNKPGAGKLLRPADVWGDGENVYVVDIGYNMVHAYAPVTGEYRFTFTNEQGDHNGPLAFWPVARPNQVAIEGKTLFLIQSDKRNVLQFEILD